MPTPRNKPGEFPDEKPTPVIDAAFVRDEILGQFRPADGGSSPWTVAGPRYIRHPSAKHAAAYIFKATRDDRAAPVCVKAFLAPDGQPLREAEQEFAALRLRHDGSRAGGFRTPEPYQFIARHNAIVMEWVEGWKLQHLLIATAVAPAMQRRHLAAAGRWLRALHDSAGLPPAPFASIALSEEIDGLRARLASSGRAAGKLAETEGFATVLRTNAARLDRLMVPQSILHDDFAPKNLIVTGGDIIGVDISTMNQGPVCRDVSEFMMYFDLFDPIGSVVGTTGFSAGRIAPYLDGYDPGWNGRAPDWVTLRYLFSVLRTWLETIEWSMRGEEIWRKALPLWSFRRFASMAGRSAEALA